MLRIILKFTRKKKLILVNILKSKRFLMKTFFNQLNRYIFILPEKIIRNEAGVQVRNFLFSKSELSLIYLYENTI